LLDLDASLNPKALHLPRLTEIERDALVTPDSPQADRELANGLMIFNIGSECLEFWNGEVWISLCYDRDNGGGDCPPCPVCEPVTIAMMSVSAGGSPITSTQSGIPFDLTTAADGSNQSKTFEWQWAPAFFDTTIYWDWVIGYVDTDNWVWVADPSVWSTFATTTSNNTNSDDLWAEFISLPWSGWIQGFFLRVIVSNDCTSTPVQSIEMFITIIGLV